MNDVGPGVTTWKPGDAVGAIIGGGGYASQVVVPANIAIPLPPGVDASLAAAAMGWRARFGIEDMCRDSWRWQSQNPEGFPA